MRTAAHEHTNDGTANSLIRAYHMGQDNLLAEFFNEAQRLECDSELSTFLSAGSGYTASAEILNPHRNSVKYRVGKAVEERGRPLTEDRLDVEVAPKVCQFVGKSVLQNAS